MNVKALCLSGALCISATVSADAGLVDNPRYCSNTNNSQISRQIFTRHGGINERQISNYSQGNILSQGHDEHLNGKHILALALTSAVVRVLPNSYLTNNIYRQIFRGMLTLSTNLYSHLSNNHE